MTRTTPAGRATERRSPGGRSLEGLATIPHAPLNGFTAIGSDLWYTLIFYRPAEQRAMAAHRRELWESRLRDSGVDEEDIPRTVRELLRHVEHSNSGGLPGRRSGASPGLLGPRELDRMADEVRSEGDRWCREHPPRIASGALRALERLHALGLRSAIISNVAFESAPGTRDLLARLGLSRHVDVIVLSPEVGVDKPSPEPFRSCLRQLGLPGDQMAYFGDLESDVIGARAAGVHPYLFTGLRKWAPRLRWPAHSPRNVPIARSWGDVVHLVGSSARARTHGAEGPPIGARSGSPRSIEKTIDTPAEWQENSEVAGECRPKF